MLSSPPSATFTWSHDNCSSGTLSLIGKGDQEAGRVERGYPGKSAEEEEGLKSGESEPEGLGSASVLGFRLSSGV